MFDVIGQQPSKRAPHHKPAKQPDVSFGLTGSAMGILVVAIGARYLWAGLG
jgi:hypothetical protein